MLDFPMNGGVFAKENVTTVFFSGRGAKSDEAFPRGHDMFSYQK